jgi:elongation factor G
LTACSREFHVACKVGEPQVAYRETIRKDRRGTKASSSNVSPAVTWSVWSIAGWNSIPQEQGKGYEFENKVVGGAIPKEYIGSVEAGVREAMETGVLAGFPMVDIKVVVYDGSYHEVDSSEMAFKIAGSMGFQRWC